VSNEHQCWYCHEPAVEVWRKALDEIMELLPMCLKCSSAVRLAIAMRESGNAVWADAVDDESGIDTHELCAPWIPPEALTTYGRLAPVCFSKGVQP
jgi:hypothetical protein